MIIGSMGLWVGGQCVGMSEGERSEVGLMVVGGSTDLIKADEIKITLLCYPSFSMFWNTSGCLFAKKFYLRIRGDL